MSERKKEYKLVKKIIIKGEIKAVTGLHIGGSNNAMAIGGMDKMVIRNSMNNEPYIPGSSLKGKMRSLLELHYGYIVKGNMGAVNYIGSDDIELITTKIFGNAKGGREVERQRPSRVIVRDGVLVNKEELADTEMLYTEGKTEVVIDRITSAAMPRQLERVPAGARFELNIVLNIVAEDNESHEEEMVKNVFSALAMVQDDYLGGNGSRGSGQVEFRIDEVSERGYDYYIGGNAASANKLDYYKQYMPESLKANLKNKSL